MNKKRLDKDELIGKTVRVKASVDPSLKNLTGKIVDETKNTFLIKDEEDYKLKRIAKKIAVFEFKENNETVEINGSEIMYRPEDRIKKVR